MTLLLVVAGLLLFAGVTLLLDAAERQRRPSLTDRLMPYQQSLAEEAHRWLAQHMTQPPPSSPNG